MLDVLFWTWFILLHCISIILLYWWDQEKTEKLDLKVKYIKLISTWEQIVVELASAKEELEAGKKEKEDPFKDWEEICLIDLAASNPQQFVDMVSEDLKLREIVLPHTMRIKFNGHITTCKPLADGKRHADWDNLYYEGAPQTCLDAMRSYFTAQWNYYSVATTRAMSGVVRLYKKKET